MSLRAVLRDDPSAPLRATALLCLILALWLSSPVVRAGVGLPVYEGPAPAVEPSRLEDAAVARYISTENDLSCSRDNSSTLDFALPGDFRPAQRQASARLPLVIRGNRALLYAGKDRHSARAQLHGNRLLLIGQDESFFNSLKNIQAGDELLVHTARAIRQYRITRARLTHSLAAADDGGEESLSLLACYPFQPLGHESIFYELRARPLAAEYLDDAAPEIELTNF